MWVFRTMLIGVCLISSGLKGDILNRTILEVEHLVYTQRDFELYILAKESLFLRKGIAPVIVKAENWTRLLEQYKNEMLINGLFNQEEQRLSGFIPNGDMIRESYKIFKKSLNKSKVLKERYASLKATQPEIKSQLVLILKVQNYLKSKANKLDQSQWFYKIDTNAPWFVKIVHNTPFRFFDNADRFKKIRGL